MPRPSIALIRVGDGGAPPVATRTEWRSCRDLHAGSFASMVNTVGAPQKWVTALSTIKSKTVGGSNLRRHTCVPPTAVTPQVKHQPLQWNIGTVHRYTLRLLMPSS